MDRKMSLKKGLYIKKGIIYFKFHVSIFMNNLSAGTFTLIPGILDLILIKAWCQ